LNEKIKSRIEQRITRSTANRKQKQAAQAVAIINNLSIPDSEKLKLKMITKKIYQSIQLTEEETLFWNYFPNSEKSYLLNGDTAQTFEFTEYQSSGFCSGQLPEEIFGQESNHWQEPNLFLSRPLQTLIPQKTLTTFHQFK
jgi:hypothetical protein